MNKDLRFTIRRSILVGLGAFFLALMVGVVVQGMMERITSVILASILLGLIVLLGVLLDVVGTAVTAADEQVFHAMAAKRVPGGTQGAFLVRHADQVANICNDVVGDVSSAISGALGAGLALLITRGIGDGLWIETFITGCIAGFTVGGKALGKNFAIKKADEIIFAVAKIFAKLNIELRIKGNQRKK